MRKKKTKKKGLFIILSSPSGAGKTSLTKGLLKNNKNIELSISYTTRKKRPKEIGGTNGPEPTRYGDWEHKGRCYDF